MADEHNRGGYQAGCRCDVCVKANSDYRKSHRRQMRGLASVPPPESTASDETVQRESVVDAVRRELALLSTPEVKPGLAAGALAMARILDDPLALAQHPAAMARLSEALATLGKGANSRRGKLAAVKAMTGS